MTALSDISQIIFEDIDDKFAWGKYGEFSVIIMKSNGYINATKMCKNKGKRFDHWLTNDGSKEFIMFVEKQLQKNILTTHDDKKRAIIDISNTVKGSLRGYVCASPING